MKNIRKVFLNSREIIQNCNVYTFKRRNREPETDLIVDEIAVSVLKNIPKECVNSFLKRDGYRVIGYKPEGLMILMFQKKF